MKYRMTEKHINSFREYLRKEERSQSTIEKYLYAIRTFCQWLVGRAVTKETVTAWKEHMIADGKSPVTVNGSLAALHNFFAFLGWTDCRVKYLKIQRRVFRDASRELTREEFFRLVQSAKAQGNHRLTLLLETICATGIRVSEIPYITLEAVRRGRADISLKGKIRTILIPNKLAKKLLKYARKQKIASGEIFLTRGGRSLSRHQIWSEMKRLCRNAGVDARKVFPHNLRHLFARIFYRVSRDIVRLADVLGHSSIETTRIYLITTGEEYAKQMDRLGLVS